MVHCKERGWECCLWRAAIAAAIWDLLPKISTCQHSTALLVREGRYWAEGDTTSPVLKSPRRFIAGSRLSPEEAIKENLAFLSRAGHYNKLILHPPHPVHGVLDGSPPLHFLLREEVVLTMDRRTQSERPQNTVRAGAQQEGRSKVNGHRDAAS